MAKAGAVLQVHVEALGIAQLQDRRRYDGDDIAVLDLRRPGLNTLGQREDRGVVAATLLPGLQANEQHARVLATAGEVEAIDGIGRLDHRGFVLEQVVAHFVEHGLVALGTGVGRHLHLDDHGALVFIGEKRGGNT
ncbi:hypothetical protein D3C76_1343200 [compost metagenome]